MRTRAHGPPSPSSDPSLSTISRKRTAISSSPPPTYLAYGHHPASHTFIADDGPVTPRKSAKRVRFSDPGQEISSGLTPHLRRSSLTTSNDIKKRRVSHPTSLPTPPASSPSPIIQEQQFTPLKQALDERIKRRLRRNHLSEEINEYEHEHRNEAKARQELAHLRNEDTKKEDRIKELTWELEVQRLGGIETNGQEQADVQTLQEELQRLKYELAGLRSGSVQRNIWETDGNVTPHHDDFADDNVASAESPWEDEAFSSSPSRYQRRSTTPLSASVCQVVTEPEKIDVACQVSLRSVEVQALEDAIQKLTRDGVDAKAALDILHDDLRSLGFSGSDDAGADDNVTAIREAFRKARLELEHVLPGETQSGFGNGSSLLDSLIGHLRSLVSQLRVKDQMLEGECRAVSALRGQFNHTLVKLADAEQAMNEIISRRTELVCVVEEKERQLNVLRDELREKEVQSSKDCRQIAELETTNRETEVSIGRLQAALESYRKEVASLENLVTMVEEERLEKATQLKMLEDTNTRSLSDFVEFQVKASQTTSRYENEILQLNTNLSTTRQELAELKEMLCKERNEWLETVKQHQDSISLLEVKSKDSAVLIASLESKNGGMRHTLEQTRRHLQSHMEQVQDLLKGMS